jgi:cell fate (sporulation/competence/biofilm development) regulator YlbF (YheA/YmcA/DUF963 family)
MKLLQLQTTEEMIMLDNSIYMGLVEKFNSLFARPEQIEKRVVSQPVIKEDSQFYKTQVELVRTGERTKATVLYISETGLLINQDPVISLTLRFHNKRNKLREITANTVVSRIAIPKAADIITIAYNKEDMTMIAVL